MLACALVGGCSSSEATADRPSGGDSGSTAAPEPGVEEGGTTGNDGLTDGGDDGDGTAGGVDTDPECAPDCGEGGTCVSHDAGAPYCECADGYAFDGATCIACGPAPSAVDLPVSQVDIRITIGGEPAHSIPTEYGDVTLEARGTGDVVFLGDTRAEILSTNVLAGVYDVYFTWRRGSVVVPSNRHARIGEVDARTDAGATIDIPVVDLGGALQFDGVAAPPLDAESGRVWLRNSDTDDELLLGFTKDGAYVGRVIAGRYTLEYEAIAGSAVAPSAGGGAFGSIDVKSSDEAVDIDIPTVRLAGTFSFDGVPAPDVPAENGVVRLEHGDGQVSLGQTRFGDFEVRVLPGAYDVVYEAIGGTAVAPVNRHAVITTIAADKGGDESFGIDIKTALVAGSVSFNGVLAPADPSDDGYVVLRHGADEVILGLTSAGAYARRVVVGAYDIHYVQDSSRASAPRNTNARVGEFVATAGASGDIDIPSVAMSGAFTLDGQTPPDSEYQDGRVYLRDPATGDSVLLGNTRAGAYGVPVVPGEYEVVYASATASELLPVNTGAVIGSVSVLPDGPAVFAIDVPALVLTGEVTIDGARGPMTSGDVGELFLVDAGTRDQVYLGNTFVGDYRRTLIPGAYLVRYRVVASSGAVPANTDAVLGCWELGPKQ